MRPVSVPAAVPMVVTAMIVTTMLAGAPLVLAAGNAAQGPGTARAIFESKCATCHSLDRPLGKTKDREAWTLTVKRMQKINGCPVTDAEAEAITGYLVEVRGAAGSAR